MGTLTTSGACWAKAGANVSDAVKADDAQITLWISGAEAWINAETRLDWVTNYATVGTNFQAVLGDVCSSKVALAMISYDMSSYTSKAEAITMLNVNRDIVRLGIAFLKDMETKEEMGVK